MYHVIVVVVVVGNVLLLPAPALFSAFLYNQNSDCAWSVARAH
jgi:hypothetical protein